MPRTRLDTAHQRQAKHLGARWLAWITLGVWILVANGCATERKLVGVHSGGDFTAAPRADSTQQAAAISLPTTAIEDSSETDTFETQVVATIESSTVDSVSFEQSGTSASSLESLVVWAQQANPRLARLSQLAAAAEAKTVYADKLPDPVIGTQVFADPIETAAGSQRANMSIVQMIPWLRRLDAQSQQSYVEALSAWQTFEAERLKVVADVRVHWYRLYVLGKQVELNRAKSEVLRPLVSIASDRIATGSGSTRDAWLGHLELSKLEEERLQLRQQLAAVKAELNCVVGRDVDHRLDVPTDVEVSLPHWTLDALRHLIRQRQPEIAAAELHATATCWGVEVARLKRRPDLSLSANWYAIDGNRPTPSIVDVGRDAWSLGAQVSMPLSRQKYDAIEEEAMWQHSAAQTEVDELVQRYDTLLLDLWERAKAAAETAKLYQDTLLPEAQLALDADIDSYSNSRVDLDSIVRDFRSVLLLEVGYHRALGELAIALARIQQAVGTDLETSVVEHRPGEFAR